MNISGYVSGAEFHRRVHSAGSSGCWRRVVRQTQAETAEAARKTLAGFEPARRPAYRNLPRRWRRAPGIEPDGFNQQLTNLANRNSPNTDMTLIATRNPSSPGPGLSRCGQNLMDHDERERSGKHKDPGLPSIGGFLMALASARACRLRCPATIAIRFISAGLSSVLRRLTTSSAPGRSASFWRHRNHTWTRCPEFPEWCSVSAICPPMSPPRRSHAARGRSHVSEVQLGLNTTRGKTGRWYSPHLTAAL